MGKNGKSNKRDNKNYLSVLVRNIVESKIATVLFLFIVVVLLFKLMILPAYQEFFSTESTIITKSNLTDIIKLSQISTYETVYNGIAEKKEEKEIKYLVRYEAKIRAGVDMSQIKVQKVDEKNKLIYINLPEIEIQEPSVDMQKLKYLFYDESQNNEYVSAEALKLCVKDATNECKDNKAIKELAEANLKKVVQALIQPLIDADGNDYKIKFTKGDNNE